MKAHTIATFGRGRTPIWRPEHTYQVGSIVRPVTPNGHSYVATASGGAIVGVTIETRGQRWKSGVPFTVVGGGSPAEGHCTGTLGSLGGVMDANAAGKWIHVPFLFSLLASILPNFGPGDQVWISYSDVGNDGTYTVDTIVNWGDNTIGITFVEALPSNYNGAGVNQDGIVGTPVDGNALNGIFGLAMDGGGLGYSVGVHDLAAVSGPASGAQINVTSVTDTGASGADEPTWPMVPDGTVVDAEIVWVRR